MVKFIIYFKCSSFFQHWLKLDICGSLRLLFSCIRLYYALFHYPTSYFRNIIKLIFPSAPLYFLYYQHIHLPIFGVIRWARWRPVNYKRSPRTDGPIRQDIKKSQQFNFCYLFFAGVVHEHPRIGSDGESEEGSRTSEDVVSPSNRNSSGGAVGNGSG